MMRINRKASVTAGLVLAMAATLLLGGCAGQVQAYDDKGPAGSAGNPAVSELLAGGSGSDEKEQGGITVSGQGSITVKPDVATVTLGVETTNADASKARQANNEAMDKVLKAVKAFGIAEDDITTANFNIYPVYDEKGQKITSYRVFNNVSVRVKDLAKLGQVLTAATDAGANTSYGISFDVLDRTQAYNEALKQAMEKARARADVMATALGVKVGKVLTINESSSYNGPAYELADAAMGSKGAAVPVQSGTLEVTASVSVVYEIAK